MQRKSKQCKCGCGNSGYIWAKGMLKYCYLKYNKPKPITKVSAKKRNEIIKSNDYYRAAIEANINRNKGICVCEECGATIRYPKGRNVSHIISAGANKSLYFDILNQNVLCLKCVELEESGDKRTMKLYNQREQIKQQLTSKYYERKIS